MSATTDLPPGLRALDIGHPGLQGWQVDTPACQAVVSRQGAQVLAFQAHGKPPMLWNSPLAARQPGKAIRGGIPLCFPWFGPHPTDATRPAHGFARQRDWTLAAACQVEEALQLDFTLAADDATRALWPHDFLATLRLRFGDQLGLRLTVANTGRTAFGFGFAFHSYFPLTDSQQARVEGLADSLYIDQLGPGRPRRRQEGAVRFPAETDRIHLHTAGACQLVDEVSGHTFRLVANGCHSVITWNPGPEKSARLADMPPDAWRHMACVESGNVEDDALLLAPGAARSFTLQIGQ